MAEELEDRVADAISRQAIADLKFTQLLSDRLIQSRERFKKEGDGGTLGALQAIQSHVLAAAPQSPLSQPCRYQSWPQGMAGKRNQ